MQKYDCIIIEDEPLAVEILVDYIQQVPWLNLKALFTDAISALDYLRKEKIDLIFLDIHLPKLKGFDFLKIAQPTSKIIVTSAYHQYALKSYDYNVADYLLKPIEFDRFLISVNKVLLKNNMQEHLYNNVKENSSIFIKVNKKNIKINFDDILYIEGQREYIKIFTDKQTIRTKFQLGKINEMLPQNKFIRIQKSFIVAIIRIESYTASSISINGIKISIGRMYKENIISSLGKK